MLKSLKDVKRELKRKVKGGYVSGQGGVLSEEEKLLLELIAKETLKWNKNNVTRTEAYFQFYLRHHEIHWAFLGHMVSRNGGWNMTDLKGELYTRLLAETEQQAFFSFLERGNWLIFNDIYPQFLLYEESIRSNRNLFHLLPHLGVSTFMETMWNYFWSRRDPYPLAIALIINEQNYLEERVIRNNQSKKAVLNTVGFRVYDFFRFNHIIFPYYTGKQREISLVGETSTQFTSLHKRILLGKKLYAQLFGNKRILSGAFQWAKDHPHTGSRKDYWPHVFNDVNESNPRSLYKRRIKNCEMIKGAERFYSPPLRFAWKDVNHPKAEEGDWFKDWRMIDYLRKQEKIYTDRKIHREYCKTLEKIELAILAKSTLPWEDGT